VLLVVPSSTYRAPDFLTAARRLGLEVVVASTDEPVLPQVMGDHYLTLPLDDPEATADAIVEHDRRIPFDAVVAVDDAGAVGAALASERLGLPHNPPDAVAAARDKLEMRMRLDAAEVSQPSFAVLSPEADAEEAARIALSIGYPCVIKPTTLSSSQGVIRANDAPEAVEAAKRVRPIAVEAGVKADAPLLVEKFVGGPEVAIEGMLDQGELTTLAVFDKPDPLNGPYFEETIYVTPSRLPAKDVQQATSTASSAARALGLRTGPIHAEVRIENGRAMVVEIAARTIGGLCSRALLFANSSTLEELVLAQALGHGPSRETRERQSSGVLMIPIPRAGTFVSLEGADKALSVPGVVGVETTIATGRFVAPVPEGNRYLGFVFARGDSPDLVEASLREAQRNLDVRIEPTERG